MTCSTIVVREAIPDVLVNLLEILITILRWGVEMEGPLHQMGIWGM
jgi:hypothetical protein